MVDTERTDPAESDRTERRREALTMGLYVAISLLAVLAIVPEQDVTSVLRPLAIVWGTTVGLAIAHLIAFRLSVRIVNQGAVSRHEGRVAASQLAGAAAVAAIATIPIVLLPARLERDVTRLLLAGLIGAAGYAVAVTSGGSRVRGFIYGAIVAGAALTAALLKNLLSGH
jgi:hypothetical protein